MKCIIATILIFFSLSSFAQESAPAGTQPEPAPSPALPESKPAQPIPPKEWKYAMGASYMLSGGSAKFDNITISNGTSSVTATTSLEYSKELSLMIETRRLPQNNWGFIGGLSYDFERTLEGGTFSSGGTTATYTGGSTASKIQFTTFYGNAVYRWNDVYVPFGLNWSLAKFTPAAGSTGTVTPTGQIGAQLGIGVEASEKFAIELYSWVTAMTLKISSGSTTADYGYGTFPSTRLGFKFIW